MWPPPYAARCVRCRGFLKIITLILRKVKGLFPNKAVLFGIVVFPAADP